MKVLKILLKNFRNYENLEIKVHPFLNILIGNNAQGKTNILESIYYASVGKSHRTNKDSELVRWSTSFFFLLLNFDSDSREMDIEILCEQENKKKIKINGVQKKKLSELIGNLNVVMFSPEDLMLVKGSPALRRKFMDMEISQVSPVYYRYLQQYTKILTQRNNILKEINNKENNDLLDIWDNQLVETGTKIILKRIEVLKKLIPLARLMHRKITDGLEELEIKYLSSINLGLQNEGEIKKGFINKLAENRNEEKYRKMTITGPHRDDLGFFVNDINMKNFGSQGQQRTTALSLKLAELEYMKSETGEYPVLLLDDVMSELDKSRRFFLMKTIQNKIQTFITTTNLHYFEQTVVEKAKILNIENGYIKKWEV